MLATLKQGRRRTAFVCCASDSFSSCSGRAIQGGTLVVGAGWRRQDVGDSTFVVVRAVSAAAAIVGKHSGRVLHAAGSEGTAERFQAATCPDAGHLQMVPSSNAIGGFALLQLFSFSPNPSWGPQLLLTRVAQSCFRLPPLSLYQICSGGCVGVRQPCTRCVCDFA